MGQVPARGRAADGKSGRQVLAGVGRVVALVGVGLLVANCTGEQLTSKIDPKYGVAASPRVVKPGDPVPKGGGAYRVGKPYVVAGKTYTPNENTTYRAEGLASWYGDDFHGRLTANGEVFDMHSIAAAHPTLPMPCYVRVTNLANGRSMLVRVNDRGPYHGNRVIDVSSRAADLLGFKRTGTARVRVEYAGRAPLEGSDDMQLASTLQENGKSVIPTTMLASAGPLFPVRGKSSSFAAAPLPPARPFDLGEPVGDDVAEAAAEAPVVASAKPVNPVRVASKPAQQPMVAVAPVPAPVPAQMPQQVAVAKPAAKPRPATSAPVAIAQAAPQQSLAAAGWVVGAQPVMNYTGAPTPVDTGRGLY